MIVGRLVKKVKNANICKVGAYTTVAPSTKVATSSPTMAQPDSTDVIYKGGADVSIFGGRDSNADGTAHLYDGAVHIQDGGEPNAPADPYRI